MLNELNEKFANPEISFYSDAHGLIYAEISNRMAKANIALHGAHLMSFAPKGQKDLLWMSKKSYFQTGKPIRGGIPICWPWFGGHPDNKNMPSHGFARISIWEVVGAGNCENGATFLELALSPAMLADEFKDADFLLKLRVEVSDKLVVSLIINNMSNEKDLSFSAALHTYFNVSDISKITVKGLNGKTFIDTLDDTKHVQDGDINFNAETDLLYLDTEDSCIIDDPGFKRKIKISKNGSRSTVVWNPWKDKAKRMVDFGNDEFETMLCVETTNAETDARTLAPKQATAYKLL
jgi:glucose-6-phosphate 1-epimerase